MLLSYVGVLFVARPHFLFPSSPTQDNDPLAISCCFAAAVVQAGAYISMRRLQKLHYLVVIHYYSLVCLLLAALMLLALGIPLRVVPNLGVQLQLIASAALTAVGQIFMTQGFQLEHAGIASVLSYSDLVFVFIWDTLLLGEHVEGFSVLGGAIIIVGALIIAIHKARSQS